MSVFSVSGSCLRTLEFKSLIGIDAGTHVGVLVLAVGGAL